jgi:hypothetical protein
MLLLTPTADVLHAAVVHAAVHLVGRHLGLSDRRMPVNCDCAPEQMRRPKEGNVVSFNDLANKVGVGS